MAVDTRMWAERGRRDAILAGDIGAWSDWVTEVFEPVANYVRWRCGGADDLADDVLQETWMTASRRLSSFDPMRSNFETWVGGIAVNIVRNQFRSRNRHRAKFQTLETEPVAADSHAPDHADRVATALAQLPDRMEKVLRAKYLDQQSVREIAQGWGESEKAIGSLLTRARQAFREAYERIPEDSL